MAIEFIFFIILNFLFYLNLFLSSNLILTKIYRVVVNSCVINSTVSHSGLHDSGLYKCKLTNNAIRVRNITSCPLALRN